MGNFSGLASAAKRFLDADGGLFGFAVDGLLGFSKILLSGVGDEDWSILGPKTGGFLLLARGDFRGFEVTSCHCGWFALDAGSSGGGPVGSAIVGAGDVAALVEILTAKNFALPNVSD